MFREIFPRGGIVVEVGSQRGISAREILRGCAPRALILVDIWRFIPGEYERDPANRPTPRRESEMRECQRTVGVRPNVLMLRAMSQDAVHLFADDALDAVYLDADHTREGITRDLGLWWPKVRSGGIVAGHDYTEKRDWIEVKPVIDELVAREGLDLITTAEREPHQVPRPNDDVDGCVFASWAVVKP